MKKTALIIILLLFILTNVFCYVALDKRSIDINAVKGAYHNIIVEPVYGNITDPAGMPFDLTGEDVKYVSVNETSAILGGREIAQWSMHSNFAPVEIKVEAPDLTMVESYSGKDESQSISYFLYFPYRYMDETGKPAEGVMKVSSGGSVGVFTISGIDIKNPDGSVGGKRIDTGTFPVRFMLTETASNNIETYEPGLYTANVTITVDGTQ